MLNHIVRVFLILYKACTSVTYVFRCFFFFFQAEDGIRDRSPSRGLGDCIRDRKQSAEVCTLEVEAIVIDNKSDLKSDSDYGQSYRYNQVVEYVVEDKKIQTTIHNLTSDPVPEGTKITLWVDPENPYIYTNNRDIKPTTIIVPIAIPIGIMLFGVLGLVFNLKKEK